MASRKNSHKMKLSITENREKRLLRVHRRSLDQRQMRHDHVNKRRQIDDMSPVIESQNASPKPNVSQSSTPVSKKAGLSRLEMLKKWKEERELKRKLESMEKAKFKPGFKVVHVAYKDNQLYQKRNTKEAGKTDAPLTRPTRSVVTVKQPACKAVPIPAAPASKSKTTGTRAASASRKTEAPSQPTKVPVPSVTRTTRSRAATAVRPVSPPAPKGRKQSPKKGAGRSNFMAPTAASKTRAATTGAGTKKAPAVEPKTKGKELNARRPQMPVKGAGKVSTHRGDRVDMPDQPSFAPSDFVFEAPSNLASFVFKPLSPASAADFLFANTTTLSSFTDRSGRTSTPKRRAAVSTASSKDEHLSDGQTSQGLSSPDVVQQPSKKKRSNSKARQSRATPVTPSPISGRKYLTGGPVTDSGIEVNTLDMDTGSNKTQNAAENIVSGKDGGVFMACQESSLPSGDEAQDKIQQPMTDQSQTEMIPAQEKVSDTEEISLRTKKAGKRKSKRISIQDKPTADHVHLNEEGSEVKESRRSRRSAVAASNLTSESISEMENVVQPVHIEEEKMEITPSTNRRSCRRSSAAKGKLAEHPEVEPMEILVEEETEKQKTETARGKGRRSRRSNLQTSDDQEEPEPARADIVECSTEAMDMAQRKSLSLSNRRRSRRSAIKPQLEKSVETTNYVPNENKLVTSAKKVVLCDSPLFELTSSEVANPEKRYLQEQRTRDDMFLTPGPPASSKKPSSKRRRTAAMIALSKATSPEEAIKIISTSPMVEMKRRKSKVFAGQQKNSSELVFNDEDFSLDPVQLSSVFANSSMEGSSSTAESATTSNDSATTTNDSALTTNDNATTTNDRMEIAADSIAAAENLTVQCGSAAGVESSSSISNETENEKRDVTYFRARLSAEIEKLTSLSSHWTAIRESTRSLSEEVEGQVRTTVCQAHLLMDKKGKFHQFAGLVDKCEAGDPSTTCQDLQGFWDMIFIQAEDIYNKFDRLEKLQQNNWKPETKVETTKPIKKVKKTSVARKVSKSAVQSKFAAFKAQMMKQRKAQDSDNSADPEEKVFDAGFFKVNSPVRSPKYHCEAGTPKSKTSSEPKHLEMTPSSSKAALEENQIPVPSDCNPKSGVNNKENMAHVLLRRSLGVTPKRRSYVPVVPSPLLQDGVSPSLDKSPAKKKDSAGKHCGEGETRELPTTPKGPRRRSTRSRKSFAEKMKESVTEEVQEEVEEVDLMAYFEPTTSQSTTPLKESSVENSPFSIEDILKHSTADTPSCVTQSGLSPALKPSSGQTPASSLKSLPSKERRKSRRSVSFAASANSPSAGITLPSTPYNKSSLVAGKRVMRRSLAASPNTADTSLLGELREISGTPPVRRSARPSLLYTPPQNVKSQPTKPAEDVPVGTLISLSP